MKYVSVVVLFLLLVTAAGQADAGYLQMGVGYAYQQQFNGSSVIWEGKDVVTEAEGELGLGGPLALRWDMQGKDMASAVKLNLSPSFGVLGGVATLDMPGLANPQQLFYTAGMTLGGVKGFHMTVRGHVLPQTDPIVKVEGRAGYRQPISEKLFIDVHADASQVFDTGRVEPLDQARYKGGVSFGYVF